MDELTVVAVHPVDLGTETIVEAQFLVKRDVSFRCQYCTVRPSCEANLGRAVRVGLISMVGESHEVAEVDRIDRHLCINIKRVRSPYTVIYLHEESLHLAVVVLVDNLSTVLHDELVFFDLLQGEKADELVAKKRWGRHHFLRVAQRDVHIHAETLAAAVLATVWVTVSLGLTAQTCLI